MNAQVDELIITGVLRSVLAFTELRFSNSMIEAWWRSLKQIGGLRDVSITRPVA